MTPRNCRVLIYSITLVQQVSFNEGSKKRIEKEEEIGKFSNLNGILVICISEIDQGTGPIKLFMLSVVLKVFIYFQPSPLLDTV